MPSKAIGAVFVVAFACGPPSSRPEPATVLPEHPSAEPAAIDECRLFVDVDLVPEPEHASVLLSVSIRNESDARVRLHIPSDCPGGPALFSGLPGTYDYYGTCNEGACIEPPPPVDVVVPARGSTEIGGALINPAGGDCQPALEAQRHEISATLRLLGDHPRLCPGRAAVLDLRQAQTDAAPI